MSLKIDTEFAKLSRLVKSEFISRYIELASAKSVAGYIKDNLFDVLKELDDDKYIATYLRRRGFRVINQSSSGVYIEKSKGNIIII